MNLSSKLDMALDDVAAAAGGAGRGGRVRGGRPPKGGGREGGAREDGFNPYRNTAGRTHLAGASLQEIAAAPDEERVLKVGATTSAKTIAGSIAHVTREGAPPSLLPLGAACVNQAVKGVAIARKYLVEDEVDLTCVPAFRTAQRNSVVLHLRSVARSDAPPPRDEATLTVAAASSPPVVAGAIAAKVREERAVSLSCVGALAVANAIFAVATARQYLRADNVDICAMPEFVEEAVGPGRGAEAGATKTVVRIVIAVTPLDAEEEAREAARGTQREARPRARVDAQPQRQRRASDAPAVVRRGGRPPRAVDAAAAAPVRRGGRPPKGGAAAVVMEEEEEEEPLGTGSRREALLRVTVS